MVQVNGLPHPLRRVLDRDGRSPDDSLRIRRDRIDIDAWINNHLYTHNRTPLLGSAVVGWGERASLNINPDNHAHSPQCISDSYTPERKPDCSLSLWLDIAGAAVGVISSQVVGSMAPGTGRCATSERRGRDPPFPYQIAACRSLPRRGQADPQLPALCATA